MKKLLYILLFICFAFQLQAQYQAKQDSAYLFRSPHGSWEVKSAAHVAYCLTHFVGDFTSTNFGFQVGASLYNTSEKNANIITEARFIYQNFGGEDNSGVKLFRDFFGFSGGVGIHLDEMAFGTFNITHYWVLNPAEGEGRLNTLAASLKGSIVAARFNGMQLLLSAEGGRSFQDMEFRDGPRDADLHDGTFFLSALINLTKVF